jgi:WD40 repeat protein
VNDVLFSKNQSDFVAGAYSDGLVRLFDLKSYKLRSTFRNKAISTQPYNSITVNAANKWLAAS